MSLAGRAAETVKICEAGRYVSAAGVDVDIAADVAAACRDTVLYPPGALDDDRPPDGGAAATIVVTAETTGDAATRLFFAHGDVVALNFASARNPGGGFLGGARAQEEDLARCSALYVTQLTQPAYYADNRAIDDLAYTDHIIVSPRVPFFRDKGLALVDVPALVTIVTAPAPNAGELRRRDADCAAHVTSTLQRRCRLVLAAAARTGARHLVLGAWGCGVFRNDPAEVAGTFAALLEAGWARAFSTVTFAVYDRSKTQDTLRAFADTFAT